MTSPRCHNFYKFLAKFYGKQLVKSARGAESSLMSDNPLVPFAHSHAQSYQAQTDTDGQLILTIPPEELRLLNIGSADLVRVTISGVSANPQQQAAMPTKVIVLNAGAKKPEAEKTQQNQLFVKL
ncbi:MAG: hypothetical protein ABSD74_08140 [Rhizomicrobium sp.]|jgi:hypothetical protein